MTNPTAEPMTAPRARRLRELLRDRERLDNQIEREFERQYPKGCHVHWDHGQYLRHGYVVRHGYDLRVLIRTPTEKETWVDARRFVELKS